MLTANKNVATHLRFVGNLIAKLVIKNDIILTQYLMSILIIDDYTKNVSILRFELNN